jgi:hypothetical protein
VLNRFPIPTGANRSLDGVRLMRWVQSALVRLPIDLAAQMRAQALGGKLKKGEFRIGRISLSALVQVAHPLTHSLQAIQESQ